MGAFDDLIPKGSQNATSNSFADLIPTKAAQTMTAEQAANPEKPSFMHELGQTAQAVALPVAAELSRTGNNLGRMALDVGNALAPGRPFQPQIELLQKRQQLVDNAVAQNQAVQQHPTVAGATGAIARGALDTGLTAGIPLGAAGALGKVGGSIAAGLVGGELIGAQNSGLDASKNVLREAIPSALTGGALGAGIGLVGKTIGSIIHNTKTPEQAATLGQAIENKALQGFERTVLANLPIVGMKNTFAKSAAQLKQSVDDMINKTGYESIKATNTKIFDNINKQIGQTTVDTQPIKQAMADWVKDQTTKVAGGLNSEAISAYKAMLNQVGRLDDSATFQTLREFRRGIDEKAFGTSAKTGNALSSSTQAGQALRKVVEDKLENVAGQNGLGQIYKSAKKLYSIQKNYDQVFKIADATLVNKAGGTDVGAFIKGMDKYINKTGATGPSWDPIKRDFAGLKKIVSFKPAEVDALAKKVPIGAAANVGKALEAVPYAGGVLAATLGQGIPLALGAGGVKALSMILSAPGSANLLRAIAKTKPGSPEFMKLYAPLQVLGTNVHQQLSQAQQ